MRISIRILGLLIVYLFESQSMIGQTLFQKQWDKRYGSYSSDYIRCNPVEDGNGNFLFLGTSLGGPGGDYSTTSYGSGDYWLYKIDSLGNLLSTMRFGGSSFEESKKLLRLPDGGYLLTGESASPISGNKSEPSRGGYDLWIVRLDSSLNIVWDKTLGGNYDESFKDVIMTPDHGFILLATTSSLQGQDVSQQGFNGPAQSNKDYWVVRIDSLGNKIWDKRYGGIEADDAFAVMATADGNYLVSGSTYSMNGGMITQPRKGDLDFWVIKIDPSGNKIWDRRYGSSNSDGSNSSESPFLRPTPDGGFLIAGTDNGMVGYDKTVAPRGMVDYWLLKCDSLGNKQWDKVYGGNKEEYLFFFNRMSDGNFLFAGSSNSQVSGDKTVPNWAFNIYNMWFIKISPNGTKLWDTRWGAIKGEYCFGFLELNDGSMLALGGSNSNISGDKSQNNWQLTPTSPIPHNIWAIKFTSSTVGFNEIEDSGVVFYPNPANSELHIRNNTGSFSKTKIRIFDSLGRTFYESENLNQLEELTIDLTNLAPGIYFIQGEEAEKNWVGKFIKSN